jgi:hypothetical protein
VGDVAYTHNTSMGEPIMTFRKLLAAILMVATVSTPAWAVVVKREWTPDAVKQSAGEFSVTAELKDDGLIHFKVTHKLATSCWVQANLVVRKGEHRIAETHFPSFVRENSTTYFFEISPEYVDDSTMELAERGIGHVGNAADDRDPLPMPGGTDNVFPLKLFAPKAPATNTKASEQSKKVVIKSLEAIKTRLRSGWSAKSEENVITVSRDKPIEWYGTIGLPPVGLAELKDQGFVHSGNYNITLEFFPPMSQAAVDKLLAANRRIEEEYYSNQPQPKDSKPVGLPKNVRDSMQPIPNILADSYSVRLIPYIQGPSEAFFNEQEKKECEGVERDIRRVLNSDAQH